jgi:hypothetical protein
MKPLPEKKPDGFKVGPNKLESAVIIKMANDGIGAAEISQRLKIKIESVKGWMPKVKAVKKTTKKA